MFALALKNSIIALLIILILHFFLKNQSLSRAAPFAEAFAAAPPVLVEEEDEWESSTAPPALNEELKLSVVEPEQPAPTGDLDTWFKTVKSTQAPQTVDGAKSSHDTARRPRADVAVKGHVGNTIPAAAVVAEEEGTVGAWDSTFSTFSEPI